MAKVFIEETTLTNIGNAIRDKEGSSALIPVTDMATRIAAIETGGGGAEVTELSITSNGTYTAPEGIGYSPVIVNVPQDGSPPAEMFIVTGNCQYRFANNGWNTFISHYGNQITTQGIWLANSMFDGCSDLKNIPFPINVSTASLKNMFSGCSNIESCPKVRGDITISTSLSIASILYATSVRDAEDLFEPNVFDDVGSLKITSAYSAPQMDSMLGYCWDLRQVPSWFYKLRVSEESTAYPTYSYGLYRGSFRECWSLDEVVNLPVLRCHGAQTSNMFDNAFTNCHRLKNCTFETDNGTPYVVKWKSQVIDLSKVGSGNASYPIPNNFNGITEDKRVTDDASYQALKNDPDWFTYNIQYTRYDHDSAVATINSLPDTSAYLAEAGGTNTIKFQAEVGLKTDGGLISNLTEEEIAVAAAKGWTVTLV